MKKLMWLGAALALAGCAGVNGIKVTESQYVPAGQELGFTPESAFGGYKMKVAVGKDVVSQVLTNEVQAAGFTGDAYLLLMFKQTK